MNRALPMVLCLSLALGCAKRRGTDNPADPPPAWATEKGKNQARLQLAHVLVEGGSPEAALTLLTQLRAEGMNGPELDVLQGEAFRKVGLTDDAEDVLNQVVARNRHDAEAHNQLGILLLDQQRVDEAVAHLELARKFDQNTADYANNLGFAYLVAGRPDDAVVELKGALKLDATRPLTRNNLGYALVAAGREKEAFRVFRVTASEADARYNLGLGLELRGDTDDAVQQYVLALNADPRHDKAIAALARVSPTAPEESP